VVRCCALAPLKLMKIGGSLLCFSTTKFNESSTKAPQQTLIYFKVLAPLKLMKVALKRHNKP